MHNRWYLNEARILGTLTGTVTPHTSKFGPIATFSLLVKEYKLVNGKHESKPEFVPITAFGKLAELAIKLLPKAKYMVLGKIVTTKYQKSGIQISRTTIVADEIIQIEQLPPIKDSYKPAVGAPVDEMAGDLEDNPYDILDEIFENDDTVSQE